MLPDRVSNPGPLTSESGALPIALRGPAEETQIKRQEPSSSVMLMFYINYKVAAEEFWSQRKHKERNGSAKSVAESGLGRRQICTALPLHWCCCLDSTTVINFVSRIYYAFTALRVHGASTT